MSIFNWRRGRQTEFESQRIYSGGFSAMEIAVKAVPYVGVGILVAYLGNAAGLALSTDRDQALSTAAGIEDIAYISALSTLGLFAAGAATYAFARWLYNRAVPKKIDVKH